jgi:DNA-directed RNA polymerase subunit N (RpoN/RPB10)
MKFKISKGTETFNKLVELKEKVITVNEAARAVVNELGASKYCHRSHHLAGGISALVFDKKPEGYKEVGEKYQNFFYPKVANKAALEKIESLTLVEFDDLNKIVGFKAPQTVSSERGIMWISTVGLTWAEHGIPEEDMVMDIENGCKYTPPADVVEILESEYEKLRTKLKGIES